MILLINTSNIFVNLCDFWNITVLQGSVTMSLRYGEIHNDHVVSNLMPSTAVKNCEHWLTFGDVIDISRFSCCVYSRCTCVYADTRKITSIDHLPASTIEKEDFSEFVPGRDAKLGKKVWLCRHKRQRTDDRQWRHSRRQLTATFADAQSMI